MRHVDMRKLPAAAQEERRRQVIGLRRAGMAYDAIAAQVGLTRNGVFDICGRFAERGAAGLKSGPPDLSALAPTVLIRRGASVPGNLRHRGRGRADGVRGL